MIIRIKNLRLRTVIGLNDWEREKEQDVIVNVEIEYDGERAARTDDISDTVDYKAVKKRIIETVEHARFKLLDALASHVLGAILEDEKVLGARVEIDKPQALRFADSVSIVCSAKKKD